MATHGDQAIPVVVDDEPVTPHKTALASEAGAVEMDVLSGSEANAAASLEGEGHGRSECTSSVVVVHSANVQEECVLCLVRDISGNKLHMPRYNLSLPYSSAVVDLYDAVAKETG